MLSKSEEKRIEAMKTETPAAKVEEPLKFRYACEGCTGVALKSTNNMVGVKITCVNCGKEQVTKAENYIVL